MVKLFSLIFIFSLLFLNFSCSTLSPVDSTRERLIAFPALENVEPVWRTFAAGVDYFHGKVASPRLEFHALRIDLSSPETEIVVRGGGANENGLVSTRVSGFVRDNNLAAGINAVPFDVSSSREGLPIRNIGIVISGGRLLSPPVSNYDALVFYRSEGERQKIRAAIVSQSSIQSIENIENAVGGFHRILAEGEPTQRTRESARTSAAMARHPRSAAGLSADGKYLYLLVIDGRRAGSVGAKEEEAALLLRALGSWEAINLDGGGSATLAMRYSDGSVRTVNTPVHGGIPGQERAVAGCLGVRN